MLFRLNALICFKNNTKINKLLFKTNIFKIIFYKNFYHCK